MYTPTQKVIEELQQRFTYHPPNPSQQERYVRIRDEAQQFSLMLARNCPPSRELSLAQTHLQQCVQMANAAIAINEKSSAAPVAAPQPKYLDNRGFEKEGG